MFKGVCVSNGSNQYAATLVTPVRKMFRFSLSGRPEDRTQRVPNISRNWATSPRRPKAVL